MSIGSGSSQRAMALDIGTARIGVAVSDPTRRIAQPRETVDARPPDRAAAAIAALVAELGVSDVIVGLPVEFDGREGHAVRRTRRFVEHLRAVCDVAIHELDERLTTAEAERGLIAAGVDVRRRKEVRDQSAAALLLAAWLAAQAPR
jgi:putative Holliday junction resolvase